jgi:hypothetical protein
VEHIVKALVVRRPWADLIASGTKDVENRGRRTSYRGPLLIVAGKGWEPTGLEYAARLGVELSPGPDDHPTGAVSVVELVDVCSMSALAGYSCECSRWAQPYQHHWRLANPRRLAEPIPVRGMPGMFTPSDAVIAAVAKQLGLHYVEVRR